MVRYCLARGTIGVPGRAHETANEQEVQTLARIDPRIGHRLMCAHSQGRNIQHRKRPTSIIIDNFAEGGWDTVALMGLSDSTLAKR